MSTKAGTLGFSERPALFTFWTVAVTALAASALILSAVALNVAGREARSATSVGSSETHEASIGAPLWDAGKLEAMKGRVLAESVRVQDYAPLWDAGKIEAMRGRVLAESVRIQDYAPLWDAGKLEAMRGRVLAG
jgi:diphthamide synthase (EF-2-diphthine--ammonia ligase)